jgi:phosphoribosyl 1,2-cyclic phosphodiesterase
MQILFLGTRGSIPSPGSDFSQYGGNTTSVIITGNNGTSLVIDAGTGIRQAGRLSNILEKPVMTLLFTHAHWDHLQGFPFFPGIYNKNLTINMLIAEPHLDSIRECLTKQMSGDSFPVHFDQLPAHIELIPIVNKHTIDDDLSIEIFENNHPSGATGVRCNSNDESITFITDNEIKLLKEQKRYDEFVSFCNGSNIIVHDGQYIETDMEIKKGWGHSTINDVAGLFIDTKPEIGIFTHHDPDRVDKEVSALEKQMQKLCKDAGNKTRVIAAREGQTWSTGS